MTSLAPRDHDVLIIGAGLAGSCTAHLLARSGLHVGLLDPNHTSYPRLFRAEKIEADQVALLRRFGLFEHVLPRTRLIREILRVRGGRIRHRRKLEQYGISYQDIVNPIRDALPAQVERITGRATGLVADPVRPQVLLDDGRALGARLVVVANGGGHDLQKSLGLKKQTFQNELSMVFGFELVRQDGRDFEFDAVTVRPDDTEGRVGYLTLFRMGEYLRANFFTYWKATDTQTRALAKSPDQVLHQVLPGMERVLGDYAVRGRVEPFRIDLYRYTDAARPGVVFLADAYQSVCPTTGMGMSKVLTDVDVLCHHCVPHWMQAGQTDQAMVEAFYAHPLKQDVDARALKHALRGRQLATERTLPARLRRAIGNWRWATGVA